MTSSNQTFVLPLSFSQERLWFFDQIAPGQSVYHIGSGLKLEGVLHPSALEQGIQAIVARHEILRTTFQKIDGVPMQVVAENLHVPLAISDLSRFEDNEKRAKELGQREYDMPFDLERGPLLRFRLVKLREDCHLLFFNLHHIIADGWSMGVFTSELRAFYDSFVSGVPCVMDPLPLQFGDFAIWQRELLSGHALDEDLDYWRNALSASPASSGLPLDFPRPTSHQFAGAASNFSIDSQTHRRLLEIAAQTQSSLFMVLLAGFSVLLGRFQNGTDVVIGTAIANRDRSELEPLIGFFVNSLPLRIYYSEDISFLDLVHQVKSVCLGAYDHQRVPFERIVEHLQPSREEGISPLFQVMFAFQNVAEERFVLPGLTVSSYPLERAHASFDLSLLMDEQDELSGAFEFNTGLYKPETIQRFIQCFQVLLDSVSSFPARVLRDAAVLSRAEQHKMLVDWNETSRPFPAQRSISEWFESVARKNLGKVAVREIRQREGQVETVSWSYSKLLEKVDCLAAALVSAGIRPGDIVGVGLHRSFEMVCSMLAILKVGAAYLPLDPNYPAERLQFMVEDARAAAILSETSLKSHFSASPIPFIDVHENTNANGYELSHKSFPESVVYVIYTSGSTGKPKGAAVFQRGIVNLLTWFIDAFHLTAEDSPLIISSLSFDLTQKNIFAPLLVGGSLLLHVDDHYDPAAILRVIAQEKPTWVNCTPSAFYPIVDAARGDATSSLSSLRYLVLGGENISVRRLWPWLGSKECNATLVNSYGPTECTDICSACFVENPEVYLDSVVPIGKPIFNTRVYVLDSSLRVVPVGVVGELWLAGEGVGMGYIHNPAATSSTFLPNLFSNDSQRIYQLRDHGRYLASGEIEFVGRTDNQVKVRGHRIELLEIEAALLKHPHIQDAVVVLHESGEGVQDIAAHLILKSPSASGAEESQFSNFLLNSLPEHMIPRWFVIHERFPMTGSGKVDRRALQLPESMQITTPPVAPDSSTEKIIAQIWTGILQRPVLNVNVGFFEIGGHSLLAVQVMSCLSDSFGLDLPVRLLFEHTTVARLAREIESREIGSMQGSDVEAFLARETVNGA